MNIRKLRCKSQSPATSKSAASSRSSGRGGAALVYCPTREEAERHAAMCRAGDLAAVAYHADLLDATRRRIEKQWLGGALDVIVATFDSFGVGLDKSNVRLVVLDEGPFGVGLHAILQVASPKSTVCM